MNSKKTLLELKNTYRKELEENVMEFWYRHSIDWDYGGYTDFLSREGKPLSLDKGGWVQGRAVWVFSSLYKHLEKRESWYSAAEAGTRFIREKLRRADGRVYFEVTREGEPLVMRRYLFSEMFASMGLASFSEISGDPLLLEEAKALYRLIDELDGTLLPKIDPGTRPLRGHSMTMMMINLCQVLREHDPENQDEYTERIDRQIEQLCTYFIKKEKGILIETVNADGSQAEGPEGRLVNPGHVLETVWFILEEAKYRKDSALAGKVLPLICGTIDIGWDRKFGGLFSFVDAEGLHPAQVEWDMKYWWPQCEGAYALLLAYQMTGDRYYFDWFLKFDEYIWSHFPDPEFGEWFGYLRRDGSVQVNLKGNHFKGPFHIPRYLLKSVLLLEEMIGASEVQ